MLEPRELTVPESISAATLRDMDKAISNFKMGKCVEEIIGLEPHPEDAKNGAYDRINLSELP